VEIWLLFVLVSNMHRPTFHAAVAGGSTSFGGFKSGHTSVKDQNGFTKLKFRQQGQASEAEMRSSNLRMELQRREAALDSEKKMALAMVEKEEKTVDLPLLLTESAPAEVEVASYDDQDADFGDSDDSDEDSRYVVHATVVAGILGEVVIMFVLCVSPAFVATTTMKMTMKRSCSVS
jgi:hypothetical protein